MANKTIAESEAVIKDVLKRLARMAKRRFKDRYEDAQKDLREFEERMKDDLIRYTDALQRGDLNEKQYKELLGDNMRLLQMKGLTQTGIALVEVDKFKSAAFKLVLRVVFDKILPGA